MTSLPKILDYKSIKPSGFPSKVRKVEFFPQNIYSDIRANDVVRFNIQAPGFWDPYNCYVRIKVDCSEMESEGSLQLDGSAQSFINELIVSAGTTEIERIQEYDVLASIINDMSYDAETRNALTHQGLNSEIFHNSQIHREINGGGQLNPLYIYDDFTPNGGTLQYLNVPKAFSTKLQGWKPTLKPDIVGGYYVAPGDLVSNMPADMTVTGFDDNKLFGKLTSVADVAASARIDTKDKVNDQIHRADYGFYYAKDNNVMKPLTTNYPTITESGGVIHTVDEWGYDGLGAPFDGNFSVGTFEDQFSKGVSYASMREGITQNTYKKQPLYAEYRVPLLSGCIGALIPKDKYKLIPAFAFDPLQIEFRINPHAMFTSGYINTEDTNATTKTAHPAFRSNTLGVQMNRASWKIVEFAIEVDILQFSDDVNNIVKSQLSSADGIIFHSNSYSLGPIWTFHNTVSCTGTFSVNLGFESLKAILLCYISNDYTKYSFCRKLFKLSRNVTWLQARFGIDFYPEKPIEGHGGNPDIWSKGERNNSVFFNDALKAFGHYNQLKPSTVLNKYNFAVNERGYSVNETVAYLSTSQGEQNRSTAYGWPMIHENRLVGRGFYVLDLTSNALDKGALMAGVNSVKDRPFDLIVKTAPKSEVTGSSYEAGCNMLVFCHYDFLFQLTNSGVRVLGRG